MDQIQASITAEPHSTNTWLLHNDTDTQTKRVKAKLKAALVKFTTVEARSCFAFV